MANISTENVLEGTIDEEISSLNIVDAEIEVCFPLIHNKYLHEIYFNSLKRIGVYIFNSTTK